MGWLYLGQSKWAEKYSRFLNKLSTNRDGHSWTHFHNPVSQTISPRVMTAGCCSIESLSLIEGTYESEDLKHVPENLRALTVCVKGERDLRIVAARCSQLRTLDLRSDGFPYLTASCLADFFLAVGPGLEGLSMKPGVSDSFVRTVRSHCKNLYSLHLSGQECGIENSIVDLVSSYSAQLKKIRLPKMTYVQYQTVAGSCHAVAGRLFPTPRRRYVIV